MKRMKVADAISDINVTPMVDVMLVLLIIFMVITPMLTKGMSVDMVPADNPVAMQDADKDDAILIAVTRDGKVFLGTKDTPVEDIGARVADLLEGRIDKTCYIRGDSRAKYEVVMQVVDNLRDKGVDQVGLLTEQSKAAARKTQEELELTGGV